MSETGIYAIFEKIAGEKKSFVPMPEGGAPAEAPMDPAMAGGAPMDPAMMAAAQGTPPPEMMAAAGMPVDPAMAAAGGAPLPEGMMPPMDPAAGGAMPIPPEIQAAIDQAVASSGGGGGGGGGSAAGGGGAKGKVDERLASIESMLNKLTGVLIGRGELPPEDLNLGDAQEIPSEAPPEAAMNPASMGGPVAEEPAPKVASVSEDQITEVKCAAAYLANMMANLGK